MTEHTNTPQTTAIELVDNSAQVSQKPAMISTFKGESRDDRLAQMKAMTSSTPLESVLNQEINLANFAIEYVEMPDQETGELRWVPRVTLVTDKGTAYHAMSIGIQSALQRLTAIMGWPTQSDDWPIIVKPVQEKSGKGRVFTLEIVG